MTSAACIGRGALSLSDCWTVVGRCGRRSRGRFGACVTFPDAYAFVEAVVQVVCGGGVIAQANLGVGMVPNFPSFPSSSTVTSRVPRLTRSLWTGGDLGELAPLGRPQVCLRPPTVKEQEVHAGRAALTNSCTAKKLKKGHQGNRLLKVIITYELSVGTYSFHCKESDLSRAAWCQICSWS